MSPTRTTSQLKKGLRISALIFVILVALVTILGKGGGGAPTPPVNQVPVANAISVSLDQDTSLPIDIAAEPGNALGNPPSSVSVSTNPTNGGAIVAGTTITYTPNPGFVGGDSFEYTITDADMETATATVSVEVRDAPPTASSLTPADASTGIARDTTVMATFSEAMDASTVSDSSFTLRDGQGATISATVMLDMSTNTATLIPDQALNVLTPYTATLSTDITDVAGSALAAAVSWSFTAVDGQWGTAELIEEDDLGEAFVPQIAINATGNAIAVWRQFDGTLFSTYANGYAAGAGWDKSRAGKIENDDVGNTTGDPQIAIDANGNGLAVWAQSDNIRDNIWSNRYTTGAWGATGAIDAEDGDVGNPQIAMDASGNALAVWAQWDGTTQDNIRSNRFTPVMWDMMTGLLDSEDLGGARVPQIAVSANGTALAVWEQFDGTGGRNIWSNHRNITGPDWDMTVAVKIEISDENARDPQIAIDASGDALAVWAQSDGTSIKIYANRYTATAGNWGTAEPIETGNGDSVSPQIVIDASGNAIAVWERNDGTRSRTYANRYTTGAWGTAEPIDAGTSDSYAPQVAIDANGNAIAVWGQDNGMREDIYANRYIAGSGWGTAGLIENNNIGSASVPQIAIDGNGNAIVVWVQDDGFRNDIWANRLE